MYKCSEKKGANRFPLSIRPKIKLFLFPLSRPTVKKSPDRKNFISIFQFFFCPKSKTLAGLPLILYFKIP